MRTSLIAALGFVFINLTGCQAMVYGTASDLNNVSVGMTKPEVVAALGEPMTSSADAAKREEKLTYRRMSAVVTWAPKMYDVTLVDGKVARFGQRTN